MAIANHLLYLLISIAFTICVGQTLFENGRAFLRECWGKDEIADAVNRLFLVGFYLMNIGFIALVLRFGGTGNTLEESLELLACRIGFVALVMGVMHFNNLFWCEFARRRKYVFKHSNHEAN